MNNSGAAVKTSGQVANIAGQAVTISGNWIVFSGGLISVSGDAVTISGNAVATSVSGNVIQLTYATAAIRGRNILSVTGASGGALLASGDCSQITLRALSGNTGVIFVGGSVGTERPWGAGALSGNGFILGPGDGVTFPISNLNLVAVATQASTTSGDKVSYIGVQY